MKHKSLEDRLYKVYSELSDDKLRVEYVNTERAIRYGYGLFGDKIPDDTLPMLYRIISVLDRIMKERKM